MMLQLSRWLPNRLIIIVADSSYSVIDLLDSVRRHVCMITRLRLDAAQIIDFFIRRWTVEVTFEEVRAHLGVETQRQWSDLAIARSTPILMAMFSLITIWADLLHQQSRLVIKPCAWYQKSRPTFSDAIASVRYRIWRNQHFCTSIFQADMQKLNPPGAEHLIYRLTRAA